MLSSLFKRFFVTPKREFPTKEQAFELIVQNWALLDALHQRIAKYKPTSACIREEAERAVRILYERTGNASPQFIWFSSPEAALTAVAVLDVFRDREIVPLQLLHRYRVNYHTNPLWDALWEAFPTTGSFNSRDFATLQSLIGSWAVNSANDALDWKERERVFAVWAQVEDVFTGRLKVRAKLFADRLRKLDATQYARVVTARQHRSWLEGRMCIRTTKTKGFPVEHVGCLVSESSFWSRHAMMNILGFDGQAIAAEVLDAMLATLGFIPYKNLCLMMERPLELCFDPVTGRLHHSSNYAIRYRDGTGLHAIRGTVVSEDVFYGRFTYADIDKEQNVEVRRVMIENFGYERYLRECGARVVHQDEFGTLYRRDLVDDEPIALLRVRNSTPEPDGTFKDYILRVPPTVGTARGAVAWTFGLNMTEYAPEVQT